MVNQVNIDTRMDRQKRVLELIVRHHVDTAEPVGSIVIAKEMGLSSATIRNIMFELEEAGLIRQPHTSAGRVPTEKGYRAYVDLLLESGPVPGARDHMGGDLFGEERPESIEDAVLRAVEHCSRQTSQTCIGFIPIMKIRERFMENAEERMRGMLASLYDLGDRLYLDGAHHLVEKPEFSDKGKIVAVMRILENRQGLLDILEENVKVRGITIYIGSENRGLGFQECSLVTANYFLEDGIAGTLGILGPMRMEYHSVIATVSEIAGSVSRLLRELL